MSLCYVKCQNIFVNVLVHLLEPLSFWLKCPSFLLSKLCFIIKVSTICDVGWDTRNLCCQFHLQGPALRILGFRVTCPKPHGLSSRVLGVKVLCPRVPKSQDHGSQGLHPGSQCPGSQSPRVPGPRVPGLRVLGLDVPGLRSWF